MKPSNDIVIIHPEWVMNRILIIRGRKVIIDSDLAKLYGVLTKRLNEQVKRNIKRFPEDFMFQLSKEEKDKVVAVCDHLKTLKFSPQLPYVFTEHGVAMLSSVLNSDRAIYLNIQIIRCFIKLREFMATHESLKLRIEEMEKKYDQSFVAVFDTLKLLMADEMKSESKIGFQSAK